jgi:hypothetical protein
MASKLRSVTVKFPSSVFKQIKLIAEKRGETISDTVRYLIARGLDERIYQENTELIARIVREQVDQALDSYNTFPDYPYAHLPQRKISRASDPRRLTICRKIS